MKSFIVSGIVVAALVIAGLTNKVIAYNRLKKMYQMINDFIEDDEHNEPDLSQLSNRELAIALSYTDCYRDYLIRVKHCERITRSILMIRLIEREISFRKTLHS